MTPAVEEMSDHTTEIAFVERLRDGDEEAYESLIERHIGPMLAVARRMMRNDDEARDVVQEAFTQAWRAIHNFRSDARLSTWLHRIVVNAALMRMRAASRRPEVPVDDLLPMFDAAGRHAVPVEELPPSGESALEQAQTRTIVRACIAELPTQYRAVIILRDIEELDTAEAAAALGISENATKIRLHRARQALATLLRRRLGGELADI